MCNKGEIMSWSKENKCVKIEKKRVSHFDRYMLRKKEKSTTNKGELIVDS